MPTTSTHAAARRPPAKDPFRTRPANARSKLTNGTRGLVLPGVDQRSAIARRFRDVMCSVVSDAGGVERLSEARLQLIRRFCALVVQAEAMESAFADGAAFDFDAHARISSTLVRLASRIGLKRAAKDVVPSLSEYMDITATKVGEDEEADE